MMGRYQKIVICSLIGLLMSAVFFSACAAYGQQTNIEIRRIFFADGREIECDQAWIDGKYIMFRKYGGTVALPLESIDLQKTLNSNQSIEEDIVECEIAYEGDIVDIKNLKIVRSSRPKKASEGSIKLSIIPVDNISFDIINHGKPGEIYVQLNGQDENGIITATKFYRGKVPSGTPFHVDISCDLYSVLGSRHKEVKKWKIVSARNLSEEKARKDQIKQQLEALIDCPDIRKSAILDVAITDYLKEILSPTFRFHFVPISCKKSYNTCRVFGLIEGVYYSKLYRAYKIVRYECYFFMAYNKDRDQYYVHEMRYPPTLALLFRYWPKNASAY